MTAATLNSALRKGILATADSRRIRGFVRKHGMRLGAARFVAGETLDDAVPVLRGLNAKGLRANTTLLGEGVTHAAETRAVAERYEQVLQRLHDERLDVNVARKLTHLGLTLDEELARENVARVVEAARALGNFIRIDMEESRYVDPTLRIYRALRDDGQDNVGVVLQSYLYRSEDDLADLLPLRVNVRIVKGAYLEPANVAYPRKSDVDDNFYRLCVRLLAPDARNAGALLHVATHDVALAARLSAYAAEHHVPSSFCEFAMLYGIGVGQQRRLVAAGWRVRVLISYGEYWFPWYMRRLAERPANVWFIVKNLIR